MKHSSSFKATIFVSNNSDSVLIYLAVLYDCIASSFTLKEKKLGLQVLQQRVQKRKALEYTRDKIHVGNFGCYISKNFAINTGRLLNKLCQGCYGRTYIGRR